MVEDFEGRSGEGGGGRGGGWEAAMIAASGTGKEGPWIRKPKRRYNITTTFLSVNHQGS